MHTEYEESVIEKEENNKSLNETQDEGSILDEISKKEDEHKKENKILLAG
jgi:hypothetical protein